MDTVEETSIPESGRNGESPILEKAGKKIRANKSSKYRGVSRCSKDGRWQARIRLGQEVKYLGRYASEQEAAEAYDKGAIRFHGDRATTNFAKEQYRSLINDNVSIDPVAGSREKQGQAAGEEDEHVTEQEQDELSAPAQRRDLKRFLPTFDPSVFNRTQKSAKITSPRPEEKSPVGTSHEPKTSKSEGPTPPAEGSQMPFSFSMDQYHPIIGIPLHFPMGMSHTDVPGSLPQFWNPESVQAQTQLLMAQYQTQQIQLAMMAQNNPFYMNVLGSFPLASMNNNFAIAVGSNDGVMQIPAVNNTYSDADQQPNESRATADDANAAHDLLSFRDFAARQARTQR